ncbi:MAG: OmpA family protein [Bacteroidales bacterium]|nr:OmpA family protein [Bacteroidales bacterium]
MIMLDTVSFDAEIRIDTTGYGAKQETGWLSMSVNTEVASEVGEDHKFVASEVSIIPGNEYILTVTKVDAETREKDEIFIPLLRDVKYDFTSKPSAEDEYQKSLDEFLAGRENIRTTEGTLIDITILSKELQIAEDDEVSFSLLPVKKLPKMPPVEANAKSSLFLDNKIVEFTYIHKYTINIPLSDAGNVNMQTNLQYLGNNFDPGSISIDLDTMSFFSEMTIDTTGLGDRIQPEEITDPVFDVVTIYFNVNEHILQPEAKKIIQDKIIGELMLNPKLYVTIKGFTDGLGDEDYNLRLSRKRAASVQDYIKGYGIRSKHIRTFSFGETQILKEGIKWEDLSPQELSKHRKVEIVIYLPE